MRPFLARARLVAARTGRRSFVCAYPRSELPAWVAEAISSRTPALEPYTALARAWHAHGAALLPRYGGYVRRLVSTGGLRAETALDLACGTGIVSAELAAVFKRVYALDASTHMLAEATKNLAGFRNVQLVRGDFRSFWLPEPVDVAICAGDSLNYVQSTSELCGVLACVAGALRPGGVFILDVQSERGFRASGKSVALFRASGMEWFQVHDYDPQTKIDDACAVTSQGVESHRRMCIVRDELIAAATRAGLVVDAAFAHPVLRFLASGSMRDFYALRRPAE